MKKKILFSVILLLVFVSGMAVASSINGDWNGNPIVKLYSSGKQLDAYDNPPIVLNDRTMIPLYMLKQLGVDLTWHQDTYSVDIKMPEKVKIVRPSLTQDKLNKIAESVGLVYAVDESLNATKQGSGFLLNNGVFITNEHVGGASKGIQFYLNGKIFNNHGETLFRNKINDLYAVKTIETNGLNYSTKLPEKDDIVYAIGLPKGIISITEGTVLSVVEVNGVKKIISNSMTDHGSSGGVLLNDKGEVIGVTSSGIDGSYINEAIPMFYVQQELDNLK